MTRWISDCAELATPLHENGSCHGRFDQLKGHMIIDSTLLRYVEVDSDIDSFPMCIFIAIFVQPGIQSYEHEF